MKIIYLIMFCIFIAAPGFADNLGRQDSVYTFSDQDLDKYKKSTDESIINNKADKGEDDSQFTTYTERTSKTEKEYTDSERREIEQQLKLIWSSMSNKLVSGDIEGALDYFVDGYKERYRETFRQMGSSKIKRILSKAVDFHLGVLYGRKAECGVIRLEEGERYSYPVTFVNVDNEWKIYGF
ncbi:MAG TPA: hypothetical protein VN328_13515, partial [Thermodesulfovibrionales bacterium]|nr:hypothetical protein [Thermodesulfovibrionales bacterium]